VRGIGTRAPSSVGTHGHTCSLFPRPSPLAAASDSASQAGLNNLFYGYDTFGIERRCQPRSGVCCYLLLADCSVVRMASCHLGMLILVHMQVRIQGIRVSHPVDFSAFVSDLACLPTASSCSEREEGDTGVCNGGAAAKPALGWECEPLFKMTVPHWIRIPILSLQLQHVVRASNRNSM